MFFSKQWNMLIVDDEQDQINLTTLIMRNYRIYGIPLEIYTARSAAEAKDILDNSIIVTEGWSSLASAFIDVVMETDSAGLELCDYIRKNKRNKNTQVFIRTGQAGIAPEREVIDKYDITGYITKLEATEDKLYALTKNSIRQYRWISTERWTRNAITMAVAGVGSKEKILRNTHRHFRETLLALAGGANQDQNVRAGLLIDGEPVLKLELTNEDIEQMKNRLGESSSTPLDTAGDYYTFTPDWELMISIPGTKRNADIQFVGLASNDVPDFVFSAMHTWLKSLAILWKRAD